MKLNASTGLVAALVVGVSVVASPAQAEQAQSGVSVSEWKAAAEGGAKDHEVFELAQSENTTDDSAVIEAASELGYEPDWQGLIEFDEPRVEVIDGDTYVTEGIVVPSEMLTPEEALREGQLSEEEYNEFQAELPSPEAAVSPQSVVNCSNTESVRYEWFSGALFRCFDVGSIMFESSSHINRHCVWHDNQGVPATLTQGRTHLGIGWSPWISNTSHTQAICNDISGASYGWGYEAYGLVY